MKRLLALLLLAAPALAAAQTAAVTGRVATEQQVPLEGVSVFVPGSLAATFTDAEGLYRLDDVSPGEVEIRAAFPGFRTATFRIVLAAGDAATLDITLQRRPFWERASLFSTDPDATTNSAVFALPRLLDTDALPARSVAEAAGLLPGVLRDERSDTLTFRQGTRLAHHLDGVPLPAPMPLPWDGVARLDLYGEHVPAAFAGSRDAVLAITTHDGSAARTARVEALAAPFTPTGLQELRLTAGTPLLGDRIRVFVATSLARQDDPFPSAAGVVQVREDVLARLAASPQEVVVYRPENPEDRRYLPFPADLPAETTLGMVGQRVNIPAGYVLGSGVSALRFSTDALTADDVATSGTRRHATRDERRLLVRMGLALGILDADITFADAYDAGDVWNARYALFNNRPFGRSASRHRYFRVDAGRTYGAYATRFTIATYRDRRTTYNPAFSDDIEDTFRYGNLEEEVNATAARYRTVLLDDRIVPTMRNGLLPEIGSFAGLAYLPGASASGYDHRETGATFLRLEQRADLGKHTIVGGIEQQQRVRRAIALADPYELARLPGRSVDPVLTYRDLSYELANTVYYGFDYLGLDRADSESLEGFIDGTNRDLAPLEITRTDGYGADRFALGPLTADVGFRYSLFSNNRPALADPYALVPLVRARDLNTPLPPGIDGAYAAYFQGERVVGYRSAEGAYFDASGQRVVVDSSSPPLGGATPRPVSPGARLDASLFRDARTRGVLQPRVSLNLAIAVDASVWLSYNRTADLPDDAFLNATYQHYEEAIGGVEEGAFLPNADLLPEIATTYALGGTARNGPLGLTLAVSQRQLDDLATLVRVRGAFPSSYRGVASAAQVRVRSLDAHLALDRTAGFAGTLGYTLSHAKGNLFGASAADDFLWITDPRADLPELLDEQRHLVRVVADYQAPPEGGPRVGGVAPLANTRLVLTAEAQSGARYLSTTQSTLFLTRQRGNPTGFRSLPWTALVHLQAERAVPLRGRTLTLFAQVRNLLDRANVRRVYASTGQPGDDGFLDSAEGRTYRSDSAFAQSYRALLLDPAHYGLPREVRLGVRLAL